MNRYFLYIALILPLFWSCAPFEDPDIDIGPLPSAPNFSAEVMADDSNRVIIKVLSDGYFDLLWDLPGGEPKTSKKAVDTVLYRKAGNYAITLHIAGEGGGGTASAKKLVSIEKDATLPCDPTLSLLTGDCEAEGKCWTFSQVAGAITVGPTYGSGEWFTSTAGGLVAAQYDDQYCFYFDGFIFEYNNNGLTVNPWAGYAAQPFDQAPGEWIYSKGTGMNGRDQIILPAGYFMGTRDSGNVLDVLILTETQLVLRARLINQNGVPQAEGWFEFHFEAVE